MKPVCYIIIPLVLGFVLDQLLGDPEALPHPIVGFGKVISFLEKQLNKGSFRFANGAIMALLLVFSTYLLCWKTIALLNKIHPLAGAFCTVILVFYSLSARTLRKEVQLVFRQLDISLINGRKQLSRIVGRDTNKLTAQQIRTAALETLSENLSDGIIAPLFWFALLGAPGMMAYKMANTLDSMIGYKNERYLHFGKFAARMDDVANYIPARLTAFIMLMVTNKLSKSSFVVQQGKNHSSPNSGYPEAALAAILNCRFGGPNFYFGKLVQKAFIGTNERQLSTEDMNRALKINRFSEIGILLLVIITILSIQIITQSYS
jgi:adenosylcobinamide-phosphate synthase